MVICTENLSNRSSRYYLANKIVISFFGEWSCILVSCYTWHQYARPPPGRDITISKIHWCSFLSFMRLNEEIISLEHYSIRSFCLPLSGLFCSILITIPVSCGSPITPDNGSIEAYQNILEGAEIFFRCNPGFVPAGRMRAVCGADGRWNPNPAGLVCTGEIFLVYVRWCKCMEQKPNAAYFCNDKLWIPH